MDKFTPEVRSRIMAAIKSKNTAIEVAVFRELRRRGVYFQRHHKHTPGKPDICLPRKKVAVFIDGDFWHGYRYPAWKNKLPSDFWVAKIERNMARDRRNFRKLRSRGWKVVRVWEHEIKSDAERAIMKVLAALNAAPVSGHRPAQSAILKSMKKPTETAKKPLTVDSYIRAFPKEVQVRLRQLRSAIRKLAPRAEERISYGMPGYKLDGKPLAYFAAFKNHVGFYPTSTAGMPLKSLLSKYKIGKGTVQFPHHEPLPMPLVRKIVQLRIRAIRKK